MKEKRTHKTTSRVCALLDVILFATVGDKPVSDLASTPQKPGRVLKNTEKAEAKQPDQCSHPGAIWQFGMTG